MPKDLELDSDTADRQAWMGVLARAKDSDLLAAWDRYALHPVFDWLRRPEIGGVMVQGRMGGSGAAFNLGEMTVTRCSVALKESGVTGHGYVQGRSKEKAQIAALVDALMQTDRAADVRKAILEPLGAQHADRREARARKAAATKVEFFTLVRGEE